MTEIEITPEQALASEAWAAEQRIRSVITEMRKGWVVLAQELWTFHEQKMWKALGYRTFDEWLAGPDIDLGRRSVFNLLETWRTLVVEKGTDPAKLEGIGISKLQQTLPAVRRGYVDVDTALADAAALSREDIRVRYEGVHEPNEALDATTERQYMICPTCGQRSEVKP